MAYERATLDSPKRTELARVLGDKQIAQHLPELLQGRWLTVEGKVHQRFTALPKAWRWAEESRDGFVAPAASLEVA